MGATVPFQYFPPFYARRRREGSCRWAWAGIQLGSVPRACVPGGGVRMWGHCKRGRCTWDTNPTWPHCCCVSSEVPITALLHLPLSYRGGQQRQHLALFPHREPRLVAPSSNFLILGPGIPAVHIPSRFSLQDTICLVIKSSHLALLVDGVNPSCLL